MEEMAFELPRAKKERCWRRREVVVISRRVRAWFLMRKKRSSKRRKSGMLDARVWVTRRRTRRSWIDCKFTVSFSFCVEYSEVGRSPEVRLGRLKPLYTTYIRENVRYTKTIRA